MAEQHVPLRGMRLDVRPWKAQAMKLPEGASEIEIQFPSPGKKEPAHVHIVFGGFGAGWALWDPRSCRQGAHLVSDGHTFKQALAAAVALAADARRRA